MKKFISAIIALVLVLGLTSAMADSTINNVAPASLGTSYEASIAPTVTLSSTGFVVLDVAVTMPTLTLSADKDDNLITLQETSAGGVTFTNNSIAAYGTGPIFKGKVTVSSLAISTGAGAALTGNCAKTTITDIANANGTGTTAFTWAINGNVKATNFDPAKELYTLTFVVSAVTE